MTSIPYFTKVSTEQLVRAWRAHDTDRSTNTMNAECRRLYLMQEIGAELRSRGADPSESCHDK